MKLIAVIVCIGIACSSVSCSTVFTQGNKKVKVRSAPEGALVVIKDEKGTEVFRGITPTEAKLRTGKPYFGTKKYTVSFTKEGCDPVTTELNSQVCPWYFGNLVLGGLLGLLIVDPLTGAVYTLPGEANVNLQSQGLAGSSDGRSVLKVVDYGEVPKDQIAQMVRVN